MMLFIIPIICILLFNLIQTMGSHHRYLLIPSALYFQGLGAIGVIDGIKNIKLKRIFSACIIGMYCINVFVSIYDLDNRGIFTNVKCKPRIMDSYDENVKIVHYIENKYETTGGKTYILASSESYNEDIIRSYYMPDFRMRDMVYTANCIDLRDGFPEQFFEAKYLIVVDPAQYHLSPESQRIVGILSSAVLNQNQLGSYYNIENMEKDDQGRTIYYLEKIKDIDNDAKIFLAEQFNKYYAEYKDLFENRILK